MAVSFRLFFSSWKPQTQSATTFRTEHMETPLGFQDFPLFPTLCHRLLFRVPTRCLRPAGGRRPRSKAADLGPFVHGGPIAAALALATATSSDRRRGRLGRRFFAAEGGERRGQLASGRCDPKRTCLWPGGCNDAAADGPSPSFTAGADAQNMTLWTLAQWTNVLLWVGEIGCAHAGCMFWAYAMPRWWLVRFGARCSPSTG